MPRADHARARSAAALTAALAGVAGLAAGATIAATARDSGPHARAVASTPRPGVTAPLGGDTDVLVPAVTADAEPLPLASVLPVADVEAVQSGAAALPFSTWSTEEPVSLWVMVNKANPLDPVDYAPEDLAHVDGVSGGSAEMLRTEAAEALSAMRAAAVEAGFDFVLESGYRSYSTQRSLFATYSAKWGSARADTFSARAGFSEHQTGWAADVAWSSDCREKACFAEEPIGRWIAAHSWAYGWIVRYPEGETGITGYRYEPWHLRYVGVELATWMHEQGIATLEEALGYPAAPDFDG